MTEYSFCFEKARTTYPVKARIRSSSVAVLRSSKNSRGVKPDPSRLSMVREARMASRETNLDGWGNDSRGSDSRESDSRGSWL